MNLRRSFLYMPGTDWRKIEKAATELNPDSICMDLEDGVALNRKEDARATIQRALETINFGSSERLVRINTPDSGHERPDLAALLPYRPDGIVIPKVADRDHVQAVDRLITKHEIKNQLPAGGIRLILIIESAQGIVNLKRIVRASDRIEALIFGAEDFSGDIGATRTVQGHEVLYARSKVVTYARAYGLQAIDIVYPDFKRPDGFTDEARTGLGLGYSGKQLIHPNQIELIHQVYTPSEVEIRAAKQIVEAYKTHQKSGAGAFALDGKMVDRPVVQQAETVLARALAAEVDIK